MAIIGRVLETVKTKKGSSLISEIKAETNKGENVQSELFQNSGIDAQPLPEDRIYLGKRTESGGYTVVGFLDTYNESEVEDGEIKIFSRDADGVRKAYVYCTVDGTTILNDDSDNAVRFSKLQTAFDQLKDDFNAFVNLVNMHTHLYIPGVLASIPTAVPSAMGQTSAADIVPAKIDNIKVP